MILKLPNTQEAIRQIAVHKETEFVVLINGLPEPSSITAENKELMLVLQKAMDEDTVQILLRLMNDLHIFMT